MKFNVTSEEFEVLCQKYNDPFADQLVEKDVQKTSQEIRTESKAREFTGKMIKSKILSMAQLVQ